MYVLSHRVHDVGYFRPFVNDEWDPRIQLMREVFGLRDTPESMCGTTNGVGEGGVFKLWYSTG